jgi:hypothetical protein
MSDHQAVNSWLCRIVELISISICAISAIAMIGWFIGNVNLTRLIPVGGNMKFLVAFMLFFSGIGLYNICRIIKSDSEISSIILPAVALIDSITLVSIITSKIFIGKQISVENMLTRPGDSSALLGTGFVAYPTLLAIGLFSVACIIVLFKFKFRQLIIQILGISLVAFPLLVAIISLISPQFLANYQNFSGVNAISFISALVFVLLGVGLIIISQGIKSKKR